MLQDKFPFRKNVLYSRGFPNKMLIWKVNIWMQFYLHFKLKDETESAYFIDKSPLRCWEELWKCPRLARPGANMIPLTDRTPPVCVLKTDNTDWNLLDCFTNTVRHHINNHWVKQLRKIVEVMILKLRWSIFCGFFTLNLHLILSSMLFIRYS